MKKIIILLAVVLVLILALRALKKPAESPAPGAVSVALAWQNDSGMSGTALLSDTAGGLSVVLDLSGAPEGVAQPAHIHQGACPNPGPVKYPLTSAAGGKSETTIAGLSLADLSAELPLAINVHKSAEEASIYVACGNLAF